MLKLGAAILNKSLSACTCVFALNGLNQCDFHSEYQSESLWRRNVMVHVVLIVLYIKLIPV